MLSAAFANEIYSFLIAALLLAGPALVIAAALGFGLGILQAVTQIQDQTLPTVLKIIAISIALLLLGARLSMPLYERTLEIFSTFPRLVR